MSIKELLESGHNVTLNVTPADLKEFALAIAEEVKAAITPSEPPDVKLTLKETAAMLGVTTGTLWRWRKDGYLIPDGYIGQKPYYLKSKVKGVM